ncbi:MAG: hypothetical protein K2X87_10130 [Gemmataceae bacterium]|nr:hypothetical protein [Gemmataceae bacterium]
MAVVSGFPVLPAVVSCVVLLGSVVSAGPRPGSLPARPAAVAAIRPLVEVEEEVYRYDPADNGAGPLWCSGSTCLVRVGDEVFASGLKTLKGVPPYNNCRWLLFRRGADGWERKQADLDGQTREPCPLVALPGEGLFLSANPTLAAGGKGGGPARPEIAFFPAADLSRPAKAIRPAWDGEPAFSEHSYRSFAADAANGELILFQNVDYTHAEWAFRDRAGKWSAQGRLVWPWGAEYDKPRPIRVCYPTVALKGRAVHFCGVSDIVEPYRGWRDFKRELTGREWDYDFRRLSYTWAPDITTGKFGGWVEIASRDKTAGRVQPCDLWVAADGDVHLLWTEQALDERLREKFFPDAVQSFELNHAVVRDGKVLRRQTLVRAGPGREGEVPGAARFQVTPDDRLFVDYHVRGRTPAGGRVSENRLLEVGRDGTPGPAARVPLANPFNSFFTATVRAGSPPSDVVELFGHRDGTSRMMSYARVRIK